MADFVPLFQETADSIRLRLDADANAGLEDNDPTRIDTREGTFYYDITEAIVLELTRVWDALSTEVPSAAFPTHAWGEYLDDHAETFSLTRKEAAHGLGAITISGAAGLLVGQGTTFATNPATADAEPIEFETTASLVLSAALATPAAPARSATSSGGFTAGNYYYFIAARSAFGETLPSPASSVLSVTTNQKVNVSWASVAGASSYAIYRSVTNVAADASLVGTSVSENFVDQGTTSQDIQPNSVEGSAGGTVNVQAVDAGIAGNVSADSIVNATNASPEIYSATNENATNGGAEVESDEELRARILLEYTSQGAGAVADYKRWALAYSGVGKAYVEPVWGGGGTVLVVINDATGAAVQDYGTVADGNIVLGLQTKLDPTRLSYGTAVVSSLTVTDSTKAWVVNQWVGKAVVIGSKYASIVTNTTTALTVDAWYTVGTNAATSAPSSGSYSVGVAPNSGGGLGLAPIGAAVTVATATPVAVDISATVTLKSGYTVETEQAAIESALDRYFAALECGDSVLYKRIQGAFFESPGIANLGSLFLNVPAQSIVDAVTDIDIDAGASPELGKRGTVTLSIGS